MKIQSSNEYSTLRSVIVGTAQHANWPSQDLEFRKMEETTRWKHSSVPSGPVEPAIIEQTEKELEEICNVLVRYGVEVLRPSEYNYQLADAMYGYCPRDRLLVIDDKIIDCNMRFPIRQGEIMTYEYLPEKNIVKINDPEVVFDAANVLRHNDDLLYLVSDSGNLKGAEWLQKQFPDKKVHVLDNIYQGVHIDSTITVLNERTVVLNAGRINGKNLPDIFKNWNIIWINEKDIMPTGFYKYPYASKWMALNMFSINRNTVMVDRDQKEIIRKLEQRNFTVIPSKLTHSRTLGGGFHCCTLDLWRENSGN
jgi:N-dimethylarginine dimethylaminohydrolase